MRRTANRSHSSSIRVGVIAAICLVVPLVPARAAELAYDATLQLTFGTLPSLQTTASGVTSVAANGSFAIPAGVLALQATLTPPASANQSFAKIAFALHNDVGMFGQAATPGGPMPLRGDVHFQRVAGAGQDFTLPLTQPFAGSYASATTGVASAPHTFQLSGATSSWLAGPLTLTSVDPAGNTATRMTTGADQRTALRGGTMNLVIPVAFREYRSVQLYTQVPLVARLTLHFTPEPASGAATAAAIAALTLLGRRSSRRRRR